MATDVIADLYAALLADPACPLPMQHRAYDYGVRRRKPKLRALLAGAPGTDPELDAKLADDPQHQVRGHRGRRHGGERRGRVAARHA